MIPVRFRPHTLSMLNVIEGGYNDSTGDYTEGRKEWSEPVPCRYEPNGQARTVPMGEGKDYVYEYKLYLNQDCPEIRYGQKLKLFDAQGDCIGEYTSKGFHRGQLDAKCWV